MEGAALRRDFIFQLWPLHRGVKPLLHEDNENTGLELSIS